MPDVTLDSMIERAEATKRRGIVWTPDDEARLACLTAARDRIAELQLANKTLAETVNAKRVAMARDLAGDSADGKTLSFHVQYQLGHSDAQLQRQVEAARAEECERAANQLKDIIENAIPIGCIGTVEEWRATALAALRARGEKP